MGLEYDEKRVESKVVASDSLAAIAWEIHENLGLHLIVESNICFFQSI